MTTIHIGKTPAPPGKCDVRPPLGGFWKGAELIANPMQWCGFALGHKGPHSWEQRTKET